MKNEESRDTGNIILDCCSVFSNVYLLPIVCPVSCVTNVSSISGLYILDFRSVLSNVYLLPIVCHRDIGNIGHARHRTDNR
jgi:hypothetical protein